MTPLNGSGGPNELRTRRLAVASRISGSFWFGERHFGRSSQLVVVPSIPTAFATPHSNESKLLSDPNGREIPGIHPSHDARQAQGLEPILYEGMAFTNCSRRSGLL